LFCFVLTEAPPVEAETPEQAGIEINVSTAMGAAPSAVERNGDLGGEAAAIDGLTAASEEVNRNGEPPTATRVAHLADTGAPEEDFDHGTSDAYSVGGAPLAESEQDEAGAAESEASAAGAGRSKATGEESYESGELVTPTREAERNGVIVEGLAVRTAVDNLLDSSYQTEMPERRSSSEESQKRREGYTVRILIGDTLMKILLYLGLGLTLVWLGITFLRPALARREETYESEAAGEPVKGLDDLPLPDPEELARRGRFGEAIHVLLLAAIVGLTRRLRVILPSHLTGREILKELPITDERRKDLGRLVHSAEHVHFGGSAAEKAEYLACLEHYRRLVPPRGGEKA
jgi:hypothetical protein